MREIFLTRKDSWAGDDQATGGGTSDQRWRIFRGEERQLGGHRSLSHKRLAPDRTGHTPRWAPWGCQHQVLPAGSLALPARY